MRWDAKYATWDNFTGKPVDGYLANRIVGTRALCAALERARERGRVPRLRPAALGRLSPATRRGLLSALVATAGGRPDEAPALSEHRPGRDVRKGICGRQVGPQPGERGRPDALSPGDRRARRDGRRPRPDGSDLPPRRAGDHARSRRQTASTSARSWRPAGSRATTASGGTTH